MSYTDQEILYAMFILKANHSMWNSTATLAESHNVFVNYAKNFYADLFADRAEYQEEEVKWVLNWGFGEEE